MAEGMDKIIDKIRKLMSLSGGTNHPAESEAALAKARALMVEYNITMGDIDSREVSNKYILDHLEAFGKEPRETKFIFTILNRYFFVTIIKSKTKVSRFNYHYNFLIFGTDANVEVAKYLFEVMFRQFRSLWANYSKNRTFIDTKDRADSQYSYYSGLYAGLCDRLEREKKIQSGDQTTALMRIDKDRENELKNALGEIKFDKQSKPRGVQYNDLASGRRDSLKIELNRGIETKDRKQLSGV